MIGAVVSKSLILFYQVNFYRFSISWPRIFPDGTASSYNQKGMDYYISLVDELVNNSKSLLTLSLRRQLALIGVRLLQ